MHLLHGSEGDTGKKINLGDKLGIGNMNLSTGILSVIHIMIPIGKKENLQCDNDPRENVRILVKES